MEQLSQPSRSKRPSLTEHSVIIPMLQSIRRPLAGLTAVHDAHGELVVGRFFNKKLLFVSDPEYIEQIFTLEARGLLSRAFLYSAKKTFFGNGLINSRSEVWSKQRRLMQPLFTKDAVKSWEQIILGEAAATVAMLKKAANKPVNLTIEIKNLIQRIFIRILLGKTVESIDNSGELIKAIDIVSRALLPQLVTEILFGGPLKRFVPIRNKRYHAAVDYLKAFIRQEIERKYPNPGLDLISLFIQAKDRNTGYTMPQDLLRDEVVNMFFAGQDTTINTLLWFFYFTGKDADVRNKVTIEISRLNDEPLSSANLNRLSYTRAVLNETLRLYPPTSALSTQTAEDVELGEYTVAKGTIIFLSMYATHRNARLWPKPDAFNPDRFLYPTLPERHKYSFFPFGGGLHNCIGRHFAELEMMLIITMLLKNFTFETDITAEEAIGITLKPNRPIVGSLLPIG
jgi:cytochrome P450